MSGGNRSRAGGIRGGDYIPAFDLNDGVFRDCHLFSFFHEKMPKDFLQVSFVLALSDVLADFHESKDYAGLDQRLYGQFGIASRDIKDLDKIYQELKIDLENI